MKRFVIYAAVGLLTAILGIILAIWASHRNPKAKEVVSNVPTKILNVKDEAIEIVFRDLIQRYPAHPVYFLSFAELIRVKILCLALLEILELRRFPKLSATLIN